MSTELATIDERTGEIIEHNPRQIMEREINTAQIARQLIEQCTVLIQGQKHLKFEGWCGLARLTRCMISTESVTVEEDGVSAVAVVRDLETGQIIGRGEGFVGRDELLWFGGVGPGWVNKKYVPDKKYNPRPMAAIRAFAQTRAGGRAARMAMSSLVILMGPGYSATPAEEMPYDEDGHQTNSQAKQQQPADPKPAPAPVEKIELGPDGRYPSMATKAQIDNLKALVTSTKSDGERLFKEFGDPRKSADSYANMLSHLNAKVAAMEGGKADEELPF